MHASPRKQAKVEDKVVALFLKKRSDMAEIVKVLAERRRLFRILRKLRTEETKRVIVFFKNDLSQYRQLMLPTCVSGGGFGRERAQGVRLPGRSGGQIGGAGRAFHRYGVPLLGRPWPRSSET